MNKYLLVACSVLLLIATMFTAGAFGITSVYYEGKPLSIEPGQTKTIGIGLSNMAGEPTNLTIMAEITKGAEIAQLSEPGKQYFVPFGTNNNMGISLIIKAPSDAVAGKQYEVEVTVKTVTSGEGGGVVFGSSIGQTIPVLIVSPTTEITGPSKPVELAILIVLIVIVIVAIIIVVVSMKKRSKKI